MKDEDKTKEQLISELGELRQKVTKLEKSEKDLKKAKRNLRNIEWLFFKDTKSKIPWRKPKKSYVQPYGNLVDYNTSRLLLDSVGKDFFIDIIEDFLDLLDTSAAIYEKNGDYALGIFASSWCAFLNQASRNLCGTNDNKKALKSGRWHCHESCWTKASKVSIETGQSVDIECLGGIHIYAVPIFARGEIVGSINFGYGDPPQNIRKLKAIAKRYGVKVGKLLELAKAYESRPPFIIDTAKKRLLTAAKMIGTITERTQAEKILQKQRYDLNERVKELNCLYSISKLVEKPGVSLEGILKGIVDLIPLSWRYPEITCARIILGSQEFRTGDFRETIWKQGCDVIVHGDRVGTLEVFYLEEKPEMDEGPFLKEERDLINAIAERLGKLTELKQAEEAVVASENKYRTLLENLPQKIFQKEKNSIYVSCNENYARDLKIKPDEIAGKTDYDFYPKELAEKYRADDRRVMELGETVDIVEKYIYDGREEIVQTIKTPINDEEGSAAGILGIFWDISERKKAEDELEKYRYHLENLVKERTVELTKANEQLRREVNERKRAEEEAKKSRESLRDLARHLQSIREEERARIAREIHDDLAQALTALKIDLSLFSNELLQDQTVLFEKVDSMSELIEETIQMVQKISSELRPSLLDNLGLAAAIEWQVGEFQKRTGIKYKVTLDSEDISLDKDRSTALFRIFQETLTNVVRHANAARVKINLKEKAGELLLKVRDNGKGITKKQISDPKSLGLIGMRERIHYWGGEIKFTSFRGKGTTVTVTIPIGK